MEDFNRNELKNRKLTEFEPKPQAEPEFQEEYDNEDESSLFERFRLIVPLIIIAIVCFISYAWYTDKFAISHNTDSNIPVIKANIEPLREKPEDPGGMKIINRDKRVYDAISGKDSDKDTKNANVLPEPEEPIARADIAKNNHATPELINQIPEKDSPGTVTAPAESISPSNTPATESKTVLTPPVEAPTHSADSLVNTIVADRPTPTHTETSPTNTPPATNTSTVTNNKEVPVADKTDIVPVKETKKQDVKAVTADDITDVTPAKKAPPQKKVVKVATKYRVQLGSYRSEGDAEASWKTTKKKFPDILNGLNEYIEKADLGDKGVFYRLQLTGFKSESDARKVCQKLTEKKHGCFFVGK